MFSKFAVKLLKNAKSPIRLITSIIRRHCAAKATEPSFLNSTSSAYLEEMYNLWLKDPQSVHPSWDVYFRTSVYNSPPSIAGQQVEYSSGQTAAAAGGQVRSAAPSDEIIDKHLAVESVIRNYQARGHLFAKLDPLEIMNKERLTPELVDSVGIPAEPITKDFPLYNDLDTVFTLPASTFIGGHETKLPLREIIKRLEEAYCQYIGVEFMHIDSIQERDFIRRKMETPNARVIKNEQRRLTLARLVRTANFEAFLMKKWASEKRFGLEGCDMVIPAVKQIIDDASMLGVEHFIFGLAHRGRLNLLANVCRKPLYQIFTQFSALEPEDEGSGDVKYHLGTHIKRLNHISNKKVKLTLIANPSHLECVNPLVLGRTKAEQYFHGDKDGSTAMAVMIHGDAAFCGQGVVYESIHLSYLPCYTTHGAIHMVINNQLGFTTDPRHSRSSPYCTDVARVVNAPIFHVNADEPESVLHVCNMAVEYRKRFRKDVVIDIVGYRRNGHNEADEPMFTQPLMYTKIKQMPNIMEKYAQRLISEKVVSQAEVDDAKQKYEKICEDEFLKASQEKHIRHKDWLDSPWSGYFEGKDPMKRTPTGIVEETLKHIGTKMSTAPPESMHFVIHKGLERILKNRNDMVQARTSDWALGEAFAFGSLLKEGHQVRLSGEDVERGTFSHRHHVFHHQTVDKATYNPMQFLYPDQAEYTVCNSSLSEFGVLGFECGYSMISPNALTIWEAQFGDFCNTAQCIIDQFISAGQSKWVRQSGLVLQLPHAMEGMGPEHSSCRPERFLQMCAEDPDHCPKNEPNMVMKQLHDINWFVAYPTTPANNYHFLRRQLLLPFRKPLVMMSPKSLLRNPEVRSSFDEYLEGTEVNRVYPDQGEAGKNPDGVKKLIMCSGKVYYDLRKAIVTKKLEKEIALVRVEQLAPFPFDLVTKECEKYPNAKLTWAQEEPKNYGFFSHVSPRISACVECSRPISYVGRPVAAAPATGTKHSHYAEVQNLLNAATAL